MHICYSIHILVLLHIIKVSSLLEEPISDDSPGPFCTDEKMDTCNDDLTNCLDLNAEKQKVTENKEVQTDVVNIKMFRTFATQTENVHVETGSHIHPDDVNQLYHIEDHNYSLGPNTELLPDDEVAPCPSVSTDTNEPMPLVGEDIIEVTVESVDTQEACTMEDIADAELSDSSYCPSSSDDDFEKDDEQFNTTAPKEKKFIVFESQLNKLFVHCQKCCGPIDTTSQKTRGSMIIITANCINGHATTWQSQPSIDGSGAGNLLIPAAILFSGNTYKRIADFAKYINLEFVSSSYYYKIQSTTLFPVVHQTWKKSQTSVVRKIKQSSSVDVCGDGRCDSPGHSAKFGTYTLMDESSRLIIEFSVVQVTEVTSSNAMEYEGCKRTLDSIIKKKVPIRCLTTDRHITVTAKMRSNYPKIKHQYDVWHLSKWVTKKLTMKAKKKGCEELMPWIQSVANHFWWSAATCDEDVDILQEKWLSLLHHIVGKHRWRASSTHKLIKKCGHPALSRNDQKNTKWLEIGSPAHVALEDVVTNKKLLKDIAKLTEFHHTGELESYHSLMTKYVPKREHFCYNGMVARTQLAILDHNANVDRSQAEVTQGINKGEKRYKVVCTKQRKNWVAKEIKTPKSNNHVESMMNDVILCKKGKKFQYKPTPQAKCIAPTPRPSKQILIEERLTRMNKNSTE